MGTGNTAGAERARRGSPGFAGWRPRRRADSSIRGEAQIALVPSRPQLSLKRATSSRYGVEASITSESSNAAIVWITPRRSAQRVCEPRNGVELGRVASQRSRSIGDANFHPSARTRPPPFDPHKTARLGKTLGSWFKLTNSRPSPGRIGAA